MTFQLFFVICLGLALLMILGIPKDVKINKPEIDPLVVIALGIISLFTIVGMLFYILSQADHVEYVHLRSASYIDSVVSKVKRCDPEIELKVASPKYQSIHHLIYILRFKKVVDKSNIQYEVTKVTWRGKFWFFNRIGVFHQDMIVKAMLESSLQGKPENLDSKFQYAISQ